MPKNYDELAEKEDRSFIIRGETFMLKRARPEALTRITEIEEEIKPGIPWAKLVEIYEQRLFVVLDDSNGALDRWAALREREEDPITFAELNDLSTWAVETVTGFPTQPLSPLAPGPTKTASSSKAASG